MRTITEHFPERIIPAHDVVTNVYEFSELSDDVKQQVRDWYLATYHTSDIFSDMVTEDLKNIFGQDTNLSVEYSLGYCQGDGLNVYGRVLWETLLDFMGSDVAGELSKKYADVLTEDEKNVLRKWSDEYSDIHYNGISYVEIPRHDYDHYAYSLADSIEFAEDCSTELYYYGVDDNTNILGTFEDACRSLFSDLNKMYEEQGYDYFYEISDDDLNDELCGMGMEFLEDGEIYND